MSESTNGLEDLKLPELKKLAAKYKIEGAATMKKPELIEAITLAQKPAEPKSESNDDGGNDRGNGGQRRRFDRRDRRNPEELSDDDVTAPCAGILDILDSYAFVRTTGYLPSPNDVYVSLGLVKKFGLRKGDQITGLVRQPKDGGEDKPRQKFNPLVRVDTVNGVRDRKSVV